MSARAECCWDMGPDVMVTVARGNESGYPVMKLEEGEYSFGLRAEEARRLAQDLLDAAAMVDDLEAKVVALRKDDR